MRLLCLIAILSLPLMLNVGCSDGGTGAPDTNARSEQSSNTQAEQPSQPSPEPEPATTEMTLDSEWLTVKCVIDGNTLELEDGEIVRLIGVDTPKTKDPRKPVQYFNKEAAEFTRRMVEGKKVYLEYDQTKKDKYGRTLAYVHKMVTLGILSSSHEPSPRIQEEVVLNEEIIRRGYGHAYTKYPFKHMEKYKALEKEAREAKIGMWAKPQKPESKKP